MRVPSHHSTKSAQNYIPCTNWIWNPIAFCCLYQHHGIHLLGTSEQIAEKCSFARQRSRNKNTFECKHFKLKSNTKRSEKKNTQPHTKSKYCTWTKWYCIAVLNIWCVSTSMYIAYACMHTKGDFGCCCYFFLWFEIEIQLLYPLTFL